MASTQSRPGGGSSMHASNSPGGMTSVPRTKSRYSQVVKVMVGPKNAPFTVHEDLVCGRSTFFKAALSNEWLENQEKVLKLPEQDPEIFQMYLECVYTGPTVDFDALSGLQEIEQLGRTSKYETSVPLGRLCTLWEHANYLGDSKLQNQVMDGIIHMSYKSPVSGRVMSDIANNTAEGSGLHRWLVDLIVGVIDEEGIEMMMGKHGSVPASFAIPLCKGFIAQRGPGSNKNTPQPEDSWRYYEQV